MEWLLDVKFLMWVATLVGIALIKFNDLYHLGKDFKELKLSLDYLNNKLDTILEKIEENEVKIAEINVRCEEREKVLFECTKKSSKAKKSKKRSKKA